MTKAIQINLNKLLKGTPFENKKLTVGVALSGGRDSVALCHLLKNSGINIVAINIEHGIRGESSKNDSNFVKNFCDTQGIKLYFKAVDVPSYAKENQITIEQAARELRYDFFESLLNENKVDLIALAHHADDQAETILMRILRGTGVKGLVGMKVVQDRYIRPLLEYSREDIDKYIKDNNLEFVEDETNKDTKYTRNFLREELLTLKEKYPSLVDSFARLSRNAEEVEEYLQSNTKDVLFDGKEAKVRIDDLGDKLMAKRMFLLCANQLGVYQDIEERHFELLFDLLTKENGKRIELAHSLVAHKDEEYIVFTLSNGEEYNEEPFKVGDFGDFKIELIDTLEPLTIIKDNSALYIDADKLPKDAVVRNREEGDYIHKFGGGTKNLGDFLTDKKVPLRNRDNIKLIASGNNILVIVGIDISRDMKVENNTRKIYKIFLK